MYQCASTWALQYRLIAYKAACVVYYAEAEKQTVKTLMGGLAGPISDFFNSIGQNENRCFTGTCHHRRELRRHIADQGHGMRADSARG